jgi:hypothetical protein
MYHCDSNPTDCDSIPYICTYNPGYQSRNYDENNFHLIIKHNQEYFQNSYFIRSAKLWNSLYQLKLRNPVIYVRLKPF